MPAFRRLLFWGKPRLDTHRMGIGTDYSSALLGTLVPTNTAALAGIVGASSSSSAAPADGDSAFGPAALLSLGGDTTTTASAATNYSAILSAAAGANSAASAEPPRLTVAQKRDLRQVQYAEGLLAAGLTSDARSLLDDVLTRDKHNGAAMHALGQLELGERNYDKAEQLFRKAAYFQPDAGYEADAQTARELQGDDKTVLTRARQLLSTQDQQATGQRLLEALVERSPHDAGARLQLAERLVRGGEAARGLVHYQIAISTADAGQLEQIEARLGELVEVAPRAAYLRDLLGRTQLRRGEARAAAASFALASKLADGDPQYQADEASAHVAIGRDRLAAGDVGGALASFEQAAGLDNNRGVQVARAEGFIARAESKLRSGSPGASIADFQQAARDLGAGGEAALRQRAARGVFAAGLTLDRRRVAAGADIGQELVAFQAAYDIDPQNLTFRNKLAATRNALADEFTADGKLKDAAYAYQRAYNLARGNTTYKTNALNGFMAYGDDRLANQSFGDAIGAYTEAYKIDPQNPTGRSKLAAGYNARGLDRLSRHEYALAAADFSEAVRLSPDNDAYAANFESVQAYA